MSASGYMNIEHHGHPRAMVEPAAVVLAHWPEPSLLQELLGSLGQIRSAGRRILQLDGGSVYSVSSADILHNFHT